MLKTKTYSGIHSVFNATSKGLNNTGIVLLIAVIIAMIWANSPWQEIYRKNVGQLADGGCLELATAYQRIVKHIPRDNH